MLKFELKFTDKYVANYRFLDLGIKEKIKDSFPIDYKRPKEQYFIVSFLNEDDSLWGENTIEGATEHFFMYAKHSISDESLPRVYFLIERGFVLLRSHLNRKDWKDDDLNGDMEHDKLVINKRIEFWNHGLFEKYGYPKYVEIKLSDSKGSQQ